MRKIWKMKKLILEKKLYQAFLTQANYKKILTLMQIMQKAVLGTLLQIAKFAQIWFFTVYWIVHQNL